VRQGGHHHLRVGRVVGRRDAHVRHARRPGAGQTVVAEFDKADASKLGDVTSEALEKRLAILLDGQVLAAPVVKESMTAGKVTFAFGTASEAEQVAAELGASATS
jgi:preprotein translocase subunit SecD